MKGRNIGPYLIEGLLGAGGIGQVYAALDQDLGRRVALKALRPEYSQDPNLLERFRNEAASLARLSHPNITMLYSLFRQVKEDQQSVYMVMEIVDGATLEGLLRSLGRINTQGCLAVMAQATLGLSYAHAAGIIHRDIKPSNLMVNAAGLLKITDFGIARAQGSQRLTRHGTLVGTLSYIAPEQIKGHEADERSDLYSLACVLYEMLSGEKPFSGTTEYELIRAQLEAEPRPLTETLPELEPALAEAIGRALAKDPCERFASLTEFAQAIGATATAESSAATVQQEVLTPAALLADAAPPQEDPPEPWELSKTSLAVRLPHEIASAPDAMNRVPPREARWIRRRGLVAGLCAALVLGLGAGAYFVQTQQGGATGAVVHGSAAAPKMASADATHESPPPPPDQPPPAIVTQTAPPAPVVPVAVPPPPPAASPQTAPPPPVPSPPAPPPTVASAPEQPPDGTHLDSAQAVATPDPAAASLATPPETPADSKTTDAGPADGEHVSDGATDQRLAGRVSAYSPEGWPVVGGITVHLEGVGPLAPDAAKPVASWIASHGNYLACTQTAPGIYRCLTQQNLDLAQAILLNGAARASTNALTLYRDAEARAREAKRGLWR